MRKGFLKNILGFAEQCKGKMFFSVVCSLISVAAGFVPYIGTYRILVSFFEGNTDMNTIWLWCGVSLIGYLVKVVFFGISTTLSHISAYTILETIRLSITKKLLKASLGVVLNKSVGKLKSLIVDRVETIELPLAHLIPEGVGYTIVPLGVFIYLISINWIMALAALITVPVALFVFGPAMKKINKQYDKYMESSNYMNSVIVEYIEGIEVIKAFNQSSVSYEKYSNAVSSFMEFTLKWFKSTWKSANFMLAVLPSTLIGTLPVGMYLYSIGKLTPAELTMCIILSLGLVSPLMGLSTYMNALKAIEYAVDETSAILNISELSDEENYRDFTNYDIKLSKVKFSYENGEQALSNVDFKIPEGSFTALVGPSGGGKSTIARMVARFWDVVEGEVLIGKHNIKKIPLSQLSSIVSYVAQDNFLFNCSIKENIRLGNPNASDKEVYEAAKAAQCDEFILKLENGYDTMAGEAGGKLSGGEKQRISLARMMLKDSPIIILDEATAFTDPENEAKIQEAITKLAKGKTLLVIAHRLSTIKEADNIVVLKDGTIDSQGTHEELMKNSNLYKHMWKAHVGAKEWAANNLKKGGQ